MSRDRDERRYASARERADKKESGEFGKYLKLPSGVQLLKPKEGAMNLQILPYEVGEGNPCAEEGMLWYERTFYVHRAVGANQDSFLCLAKTFKEPCPICEFRAKLGSEDEDLIKDLAPKERQLFNVRNTKDDKGVQIWDVSYHLFGKQLDAEIRNSEEGDRFDEFFYCEGGSDLRVGFAEESFGGRAFNKVQTITFRPRRDDLDEKEILEETHCLDELLVKVEYDDLKKIFLQTVDEDGNIQRPKKKEDTKPRGRDDVREESRASSKKSRREEPEEEEDEPKPRRSKVPVDEEEEQPRRKTSKDETWDDEPVPRSRRSRAPVEEEEERPRVKTQAEEEDEEKEERPSRKSRRNDEPPEEEGASWDDFDDKPKSKKSRREEPEEEEDEPKPRRSKVPVDEEAEEEEESPRKKPSKR